MKDWDQLLITLGTRIQKLRQEKTLSQHELAGRCDLDKASLSRIETGKANITLRTLTRISSALEVSISELFE